MDQADSTNKHHTEGGAESGAIGVTGNNGTHSGVPEVSSFRVEALGLRLVVHQVATTTRRWITQCDVSKLKQTRARKRQNFGRIFPFS